MSEESRDALLIQIGELRGSINGHDKRLDQQHNDILRLAAALDDHKATMLKCFAESEMRTNNAIEKAISQLSENMTTKLQLVAQKAAEHVLEHTVNGPMKLDEFIHNRPKTALALSGILAAIITKMATIWGLIPAV